MNNLSQRTKIIIISVATLLVMGLLIAVVLFFSGGKREEISDDKQYVDKNSGEIVSAPEGKTPENFDDTYEENNTVLYLGTAELLNNGTSRAQLDNMKLAFDLFATKRGTPLKRVSVTAGTVKATTARDAGPNGLPSISFGVEIDQKDTYTALLQYVEYSSVQLLLNDASGARVFDSGVVDTPYGSD